MNLFKTVDKCSRQCGQGSGENPLKWEWEQKNKCIIGFVSPVEDTELLGNRL